MGWIDNFTPEVVTAIGVCFGAFLGGLSALIKEFRQPKKVPAEELAPPAAKTEHVLEVLDEELQHLDRTIWIVEKRLSDRLQRIEVRLGLPDKATAPPE